MDNIISLNQTRQTFSYQIFILRLDMESKQDYFRSPHPRNFFLQANLPRNQNQDDSIFAKNLFNSCHRNNSSPFRLYQPIFISPNQDISNSNKNNNQDQQIKSHIDFDGKDFQSQHQYIQEIENSSQFVQTPKKESQKQIGSLQNTTARKKSVLSISRYSSKPLKYNMNHRDHSRGLRNLSRQALEILRMSNPLSYQQVADRMIEQKQQNGQIQNNRQKQSIKRRVYDVLNVLIAVDLLSKNGKKTVFNKTQNHKKIDKQAQNEVKQKISKMKRTIQNKRQELEKLKLEYQSINNLISRNKKMSLFHGKKIMFPFVIGTQLMPKTSHQQKIVIKELICGDLDAICFIDYRQNY